ncbi:MAG: PilZ domain-containing protein [Spirochaetota bacterium]|nr:PilZ domain-containing protein [Spirochaetota bacterium]
MEDRRIEPRIDTAFIVKCKVLPKRDKTFFTVINNLSTGGIKIFCDKSLPLGKNVDVNINLLQETAEAKAQVVWCSKKKNYSGRYLVGLKFLEVNETNMHKLGNFINVIQSY